MLGAAGRAASGLVKQASKAGNVASVLPAASVARKFLFVLMQLVFLTYIQLFNLRNVDLACILLESAVRGSHLVSIFQFLESLIKSEALEVLAFTIIAWSLT